MATGPRITARTVVRTNRIPQVIAHIVAATNDAVQDTAVAIQNMASQLAPRDTGALAASIYVSSSTESDYDTRVATASALNRDMIPLEEVAPEFVIPLAGTNTGNVAVVGAAAHYGIFNEEGTVHMAPRPFMRPATEGASDDFQSRMSQVANGV